MGDQDQEGNGYSKSILSSNGGTLEEGKKDVVGGDAEHLSFIQEEDVRGNPTIDQGTTPISTSARPWYEYADTVLVLAVFLGAGFNFSILCQTLIDLEKITNANTDQISGVFLWRGIGMSVSTLFLGFLYDYFNHNLILSVCMALVGACQASMPFQTDAVVLSVIFGIQSIGVGLLSVGVTLRLVNIWKTKSGPFLQAQYLMYVIAGCITPLIINTFVRMDVETPTDASHVHTNDADMFKPSTEVNYTGLSSPTSAIHPNNASFAANSITVKDAVNEGNLTLIPIVDIIPVYLLCTGYVSILSVICMVMAFIVRPIYIKKRKIIGYYTEKKQRKCMTCGIEKVLKVAIFTVMMTLECVIDFTLVGLIITFIVKELHWSQEEALYISSVLFFSSGVTRLLAVVVSRVVSNVSIIAFDCLLGTIAVFILATLVHHHRSIIWVSVIALGVAYSTVMPSTTAWAGDQINVTGIITSIFVTPLGTGLILGPRVVGLLFQMNGPMWYAYMLCLYVVALDVFFILAFILCKMKPLKHAEKVQVV